MENGKEFIERPRVGGSEMALGRAPYNLASGGARAVVGESRPLQSALNEHGDQLSKLGDLVSTLEDRLHSIRNSSPATENSVGEDKRSGSQVYNQIADQTINVKNLQYRVSSLLEELEI